MCYGEETRRSFVQVVLLAICPEYCQAAAVANIEFYVVPCIIVSVDCHPSW